MLGSGLFSLSQSPRANGLRLLLLNSALCVFSVVSFLGGLLLVSSLNRLQHTLGSSPSAELPFPYPLLLILDVVLCLTAWIWFGRRLPQVGRSRLQVALIGAGPLFAFSLLLCLGAAGAFLANDVNPAMMPVAGVFVFGAFSVLLFLAGLVCVGVILWPRAKAEV